MDIPQLLSGVPTRLAQAAITASPVVIYTSPANQRSSILDINIVNTTNGALTVNVYIGAAAAAANALYYAFSCAANSTTRWTGFQIINGGETITVSASNTGLSISISGMSQV